MPDLAHFSFQGRVTVACGIVGVSLPSLPSLPKKEIDKWQYFTEQKILAGQVRKVGLKGWVEIKSPRPSAARDRGDR